MMASINTILSHPKYIRWLLLTPALLIVAALTLFPLISVGYMSLHKYSYIQGTKSFAGLTNFVRLVKDQFFLVSLKNTFTFAFLATFAEVILGLGFALLFKEPFVGRKYLLSVVILPMLLSTMVVCATWKVLYHYDYGLFNYVLRGLRIAPVNWLADKSIVMFSVVLVEIWQWTPFSFLVLLAGLQGIPPEFYEAARVDGANRVRLFWHITLPLLRPHVLLVILLRSIDTFRIFDKVYALTGGGPGNATETISFYIYREGFMYFHIDRASAASVVMLGIVAAVSAIYISMLFRDQTA